MIITDHAATHILVPLFDTVYERVVPTEVLRSCGHRATVMGSRRAGTQGLRLGHYFFSAAFFHLASFSMRSAFSLSRLASARNSRGVLFFAPGVLAITRLSKSDLRFIYDITLGVCILFRARTAPNCPRAALAIAEFAEASADVTDRAHSLALVAWATVTAGTPLQGP